MAKEIKRTRIGAKIREQRKKMHLTQEQVADKLGLNRSNLARYETDTMPPLGALNALCSFFGITLDEIAGEEDNYNIAAANLEKSLITLASANGYNNDNCFSNEELEILVKIVNMSKDKREQLMKHIEAVIEDEENL